MSKSKEIATIGHNSDPRKAMKLVRSEVKNAVKNNHRVDLMGYTEDDIPRSQIALQDMLTTELTKKKKASDHIRNMKDIIDMLSLMTKLVVEDAEQTILEQQAKIAELTKCLDSTDVDMASLYKENARLAEGWQDANQRLSDTETQLAAAMQTIKTMSEGIDFA